MGPPGSVYELALLALASLLIALLAYREKVLDPGGSGLAFLICFIVGALGHWSWLLLLLVFVGGSYLATRFAFSYKVRLGVEESETGMRGGTNVLANGAVPALVALAYAQADLTGYSLLGEIQALVAFTTALAVASADTLASEVGVLDPEPVLITDLRTRVPPGTDGGISPLGILTAALASLTMTLVAIATFVALDMLPGSRAELIIIAGVPFLFGFAGCQIDSFLGAVAERRGWLGNGSVNFIAIGLCTLLSVPAVAYL